MPAVCWSQELQEIQSDIKNYSPEEVHGFVSLAVLKGFKKCLLSSSGSLLDLSLWTEDLYVLLRPEDVKA